MSSTAELSPAHNQEGKILFLSPPPKLLVMQFCSSPCVGSSTHGTHLWTPDKKNGTSFLSPYELALKWIRANAKRPQTAGAEKPNGSGSSTPILEKEGC